MQRRIEEKSAAKLVCMMQHVQSPDSTGLDAAYVHENALLMSTDIRYSSFLTFSVT